MKSTVFRVTVKADAGQETHEVEVTHQDRLRAEQMAYQLGVPGLASAPLTGTTMWCWAALKRTKTVDVTAKRFLDEVCIDVEPVKDAEAEIPPTGPTPGTD